MKNHFLRILFLILIVFTSEDLKAGNALGGDTAFIRTYGGVNFEEFRDIVQTPDSGFLMCGITNGYGQGSNAIYVVKAKKDGTHVWSRALGGVSADLAYSIAATNSGQYLIAGTSSSGGNGGYDGYLICIDDTGGVVWDKYYGGTDWDFLNSIAILPDQSILLAGESYTYSDGGSDAWILHLNSIGDTIWTNHFGSSGNDAFKNICLSSTAIYLSGYVDSTDADGLDGYLVKLDFNGNEIWQKRFNNLGRDLLNGCLIEPNGELVIYGSTAPFDSTKNDIWVEKTDTNGTSIWISNSGSQEDDYANKVISIRNDEYAIIGQKNPSGLGNKSMFTAQYNSGGFQLSSHSFGGGNDEEGYNAIRTIEGGIAFVGYSTSFGFGNKDAMLVILRYDSIINFSLLELPVPYFEILSPIGVDDIDLSKLVTVYPNPASTHIQVKSDPELAIESIMIQDVLGKNLFLDIEVNASTFSVDFLPSGIYVLKIRFENNKNYMGKLVIVK